jgi:hypothetical protein
MKRLILIATLLMLVGLAPRAIFAQDATPAASGTAAPSLLAGLGYPDLVVNTDGTTNDLPADIAAGRYHVVLNNTNATNAVELDFYIPPAGISKDDALAFYGQAMSQQQPPEMFYQLTIPGGVSAPPNGTADAIIDLNPGDTYAGIQTVSENGPGTGGAQALSVTGTMPELVDPDAAVTVTLSDLKVDMPDTVPAGPQIWKITSTGAMPHFLAISKSDGSLTQENVAATLGSMIGTPIPAGMTPVPDSALQDGPQSAVITGGQTIWLEIDLEPGQYLGACFMSGPGDLPVHAALGMFKIFNVA